MKKKSGKTKIDLAVDMLEYVKKRLNIESEYDLFDSYYAANKILKRCEEYGWNYLGRVKKDRILDGMQIHRVHRHPRWSESVILSCKPSARIVLECKRYFVTAINDLEQK